MTVARGSRRRPVTLLHDVLLTFESASAARCIIFGRQHEREEKVEVEQQARITRLVLWCEVRVVGRGASGGPCDFPKRKFT